MNVHHIRAYWLTRSEEMRVAYLLHSMVLFQEFARHCDK